MQNEIQDSPGELLPYSPEQDVFRAILFEGWIKGDGKSARPQAFKRIRKDISGLSVGSTIEGCQEGLTGATFGQFMLNVGKIREIKNNKDEHLDVVPDSPTHGNITGLPFKDEIKDQLESTKLAQDLAKLAIKYPPVDYE